ncbi:hypothetical protein GP475_01060 [Corynebacterium poyangense]|uniref:Uncharacterized protein n=1 Tax=Corynebacterium poyangense TaxID=2684405 RepID=A0A7H0SLF1_9CORY|nr:hypothetical protein [Corynebacterium poyangense]MBZ8177469.1 hypothetical protein [Corynebacterium poyangense]QNQ89376.1 hypothetical protein GP475_01060 [Corynebacterium poyangense]
MDNPESFGATELKWLEHTFINLAKKSGFTKLVNAPTPFEGVIESALLNDFKSTVADARLMMATMRYPVLEPALPTVPKQTPTPGEELEQGTEPKRGATSQELFIHLGGISKPAGRFAKPRTQHLSRSRVRHCRTLLRLLSHGMRTRRSSQANVQAVKPPRGDPKVDGGIPNTRCRSARFDLVDLRIKEARK